jgi:hypothetical protein
LNGDEQYGYGNVPDEDEDEDEEIEVQLEIQEVQQFQQQQGIPNNPVDCHVVIADDEAEEEADAGGLLARLYAAWIFGWDEMKSRREKAHISQASCMLLCCDLGYKKNTGKYALERWLKQIKASIEE